MLYDLISGQACYIFFVLILYLRLTNIMHKLKIHSEHPEEHPLKKINYAIML